MVLAALLAAACGSTAPAPPTPAAAPAAAAEELVEIQSVEVHEDNSGVQLAVATSGPMIWTSYRDSEGRLVVELPNSVPAATVAGLNLQQGMIESASIEVGEDRERPMTRLVVTTRAEAEHSVAADGARLLVDLMPIERVEMAPAAVRDEFFEEGEPVEIAALESGTPETPELGPAPAGVPATQLREVEVSAGVGATVVSIRGDGEFYYSTFALSQPERFVVDLIGVVNTASVSSIAVEGDLVDRVRVAQFKPQPELVSRVVIDLLAPAEPVVTSGADGLMLSFSAPAAMAEMVPEPAAEAVEDVVETAMVAAAAEAEVVEAEREAAAALAAAEVEIEEAEMAAAEADAAVEDLEADMEVAEMAEEALAEEVMGAEAALPGPAPAEEVWEESAAEEAWEEPAAEEAWEEPAAEEAWEETAWEEEAWEEEETWEEPAPAAPDPVMPPVEPRPLPEVKVDYEPEAAVAEPAPEIFRTQVDLDAPATDAFAAREVSGGTETGYEGEPITMSLKDAEIKDVLRSFAQISGLNVVVQPGVTGTVTVELTNVPWDQALDQILKINGLDYQLEGNIMRIAPVATLRQEAEEKQRLEAAKALSVPLRTIIRRISYATAQDIAGLLVGGQGSVMSQRGSVVVDARTNTLIIKELPSHIDTVIAVIENLDIPEPQVMIEARIIETTKRFTSTLGIQWGITGIADAAHGNTTGLEFPNNINASGGVNALIGGETGSLNISLGNVLNTFNLDAVLQAAENEGLINILSAPKITTLNNERASIQSGLQIPIQTVANNTVSVQFVNATLRLDVTPHVTAEGTVLMDIDIQKREPQLAFAVVGASNAPIATKDARTRVIVRDGGTTVIGGIYKVTSDQGEDRVPGLANVPVLKHLFKNKRRNDENEELLIFISPRVVRL